MFGGIPAMTKAMDLATQVLDEATNEDRDA